MILEPSIFFFIYKITVNFMLDTITPKKQKDSHLWQQRISSLLVNGPSPLLLT